MQKKIEQKFSIPYYHQSNGRVERANRTLRNAFRKRPGATKMKLKKIVDAYNNTIHRGIGMTPIEACLESNREEILRYSEKYKKEFRNNSVRDAK